MKGGHTRSSAVWWAEAADCHSPCSGTQPCYPPPGWGNLCPGHGEWEDCSGRTENCWTFSPNFLKVDPKVNYFWLIIFQNCHNLRHCFSENSCFLHWNILILTNIVPLIMSSQFKLYIYCFVHWVRIHYSFFSVSTGGARQSTGRLSGHTAYNILEPVHNYLLLNISKC